MIKFITLILATVSTLIHANSNHLCQFFPHNDSTIPVSETFLEVNGISKDDYLQVINRLQVKFAPFVAAKTGRQLVLNDNWTMNEVNAYADQITPGIARVSIYGGLARYETMTVDAFALVTCHELAHHLGGYPTYQGQMQWESLEGQADYWGSP